MNNFRLVCPLVNKMLMETHGDMYYQLSLPF